MTVSEATKFLENAHKALNKEYFDNTLSSVMITIQSSRKAYGHYTLYEAWQGKKGYKETI